MAHKKALTFIFLIFFISVTSGCINTGSLNKGLVTEYLNTQLTEDPVREENSETQENNVAEKNESDESFTLPEIPEVPTYIEEGPAYSYSAERRRMSLSFQRAINSDEERIKEEIFNITGKSSGYNMEDACAVYNHVNRQWKYRYDKNAEFFFRASQTIDSGYVGDCDDYSIVISALLKNMGFNTRVVTTYNGSYGHAFPELYIGDDLDTVYRITDYIAERYPFAESVWYCERELDDGKKQYWLNFDWSGSNGYMHPGGVYFDGKSVIYYPNGLVEY